MDRLVSSEWLAGELGAPDLVVVDASQHMTGNGRDAAAEFAAGHVPGARFLDLASFTDPASPTPKAIPSPAQFAERMAALGIAPDSRVVLYDDSAIRSAARAWFLFEHYGHGNVAILDGGLGKWRAEGRAMESGDEPAAPASYPIPGAHRTVLDKSAMLANCAAPDFAVVDARDAGRFSGATCDTVHGLEGGHIPGARNLPFTELLAGDGTYLPRAELAALFNDAGIDPARPFAASCGSGMTACVVLFAAQLLGHEGALYDGSWMEWGADPATPKETGMAA